MASPSAPPAVPWRTVMRERSVSAPRATTWAALLDVVGDAPGDLSVEPPWRHVRRVEVPGVERAERTVTIRDDGDECHLAWCLGVTAAADDEAAGAELARQAADGGRILDSIAARVL